jgi:hypothetical protein
MVFGSWRPEEKSEFDVFGPTYHESDEGRVPHQRVQRQALAVPAEFRSRGMAISVQIAALHSL